MALRNREEKTVSKLQGVSRAATPSKLELGWFHTLQNWIPGKLTSIKKKRGVESLSNVGLVVIPGECVTLNQFELMCGLGCGFGQAVQVVYDGATDPGGVALRVPETATFDNFTGLAAIYVPDQGAIGVWLYENEQALEEGTLVVAFPAVLVVDDVLAFRSDVLDAEHYEVLVNDAVLFDFNVPTETISVENPCVALVAEINIITDPIVSDSEGEV